MARGAGKFVGALQAIRAASTNVMRRERRCMSASFTNNCLSAYGVDVIVGVGDGSGRFVSVGVGTGVSVTVGVSVLYTGVGVNGVLVAVLLAVGVGVVVGSVGAQGGT